MTEQDYLALPEREKDALVCGTFEPKPTEGPTDNPYWLMLINSVSEDKFWKRIVTGEHRDECGFSIMDVEWMPIHVTTSISAAWQVVEKMRGDGFSLILQVAWDNKETVYACFLDCTDGRAGDDVCDTAPLAICLAALKARGMINAMDSAPNVESCSL